MDAQAQRYEDLVRDQARFLAVLAVAPAVVTGGVALAIGGSLGEALLASGMVGGAAGIAGAAVWGIGNGSAGRRLAVGCCIGLAAFLILACYVYGRLSGIPTEELRVGLGVVMLAMGLAGISTAALNLPRPPAEGRGRDA